MLTLEQQEFELRGPLIQGFFWTVNAMVLQDPWLVESCDAEPRIRNNCGTQGLLKITADFPLIAVLAPRPCCCPRVSRTLGKLLALTANIFK